MMTHYTRGARSVDAECQTCGKRWCDKNAQGVAARHSAAHGHSVHVEIVQYLTYCPESEPPEEPRRG